MENEADFAMYDLLIRQGYEAQVEERRREYFDRHYPKLAARYEAGQITVAEFAEFIRDLATDATEMALEEYA